MALTMPTTTATSKPSLYGRPKASTATVPATSTPHRAARSRISVIVTHRMASVPAKPSPHSAGTTAPSTMPMKEPVCQASQLG